VPVLDEAAMRAWLDGADLAALAAAAA
jgi:hypothetical protein